MLAPPLPPPPPPPSSAQVMTYAQLAAAHAALPPIPQLNLRMRRQSVVSFSF